MFSLPAVQIGHKRIDRGDPDSDDKTLSDFTADGTWNTLDLSSIVPANAKWVFVTTTLETESANGHFELRKNGNSYAYNVMGGKVHAGLGSEFYDYACPIGANGIIEYNLTNVTWTIVNLTVIGWLV